MPDHVHLPLEGVAEASDLAKAMHAWKQRTGYDWKRRHGTPLWQEGFHDRVLRAEDDTPAVVRYLLENPVRAGLVATVTDYPWIGSSRFSIEQLLEESAPWTPSWKRFRN
jgi:REP element-mobilizing transposase RayT